MSDETPKNNIIRFPTENVPKFGFERVKAREKSEAKMEREGQMSLFEAPKGAAGDVVKLPTQINVFDEALVSDDNGDDRAAELYRRAIADGVRVADAYCNLGVLETQNGRSSEAFECFTKALKQDPRHFESHYNVANLYFENGELRPAKLHYEVAAELDPDFPNVYFNLGIVNAMSEDLQAAIESLATYRDLAPEDEARKADELLASLRLTIRMRS